MPSVTTLRLTRLQIPATNSLILAGGKAGGIVYGDCVQFMLRGYKGGFDPKCIGVQGDDFIPRSVNIETERCTYCCYASTEPVGRRWEDVARTINVGHALSLKAASKQALVARIGTVTKGKSQKVTFSCVYKFFPLKTPSKTFVFIHFTPQKNISQCLLISRSFCPAI